MQRKPDVDPRALAALLQRVMPQVSVGAERTRDGTSTQVYRLIGGPTTLYLRIAEDRLDDLRVDAEVLQHLHEQGVSVPEVVYVEPHDSALDRSVMITTELPGEPLASVTSRDEAAGAARAAGRDVALVNQVSVVGYGWIRRIAPGRPPTAELESYGQFVTEYLFHGWREPLARLFSPSQTDALVAVIEFERRRQPTAKLAHGDLDVTHIFCSGGRYTGIIDFGEMRGADSTWDLGHFLLHDAETSSFQLFDSFLSGYLEVDGSANGSDRIVRSALLVGLRQLCRWIGPKRNLPLDHRSVALRVSQLANLLNR